MEQWEKIIRYLDGEITGEEKTVFEHELSVNNSLNSSVRLAREVDATLNDKELQVYIEKLNEARQTVTAEEQIPFKSNHILLYNWKMIAAATVTVIATISVVLYLNTNPSNNRLFSKYYQRYEADILTRSAGPSEVSDLIKAIQFYDKENYKEAILQFEKILRADNKNTAAHFFMGVSCIETQNFTKAIENLHFVIDQNDVAFTEHAEWYMSLCFLKTNQKELAKSSLIKIAGKNTFYHSQAQELLKKLR